MSNKKMIRMALTSTRKKRLNKKTMQSIIGSKRRDKKKTTLLDFQIRRNTDGETNLSSKKNYKNVSHFKKRKKEKKNRKKKLQQ